jgi:hypothetical protein
MLSKLIGSKVPDALKIPARRVEYSLRESASSPVQAEPRQERVSMDERLRRFSPTVLAGKCR